MDVPAIDRVVIITDAAVNIFPTLEDKVHIVQNAIDLARALGLEQPKVAILSAMETVNPKVPSTIEAAALCKMAERGQITGGVLDGPLALRQRHRPGRGPDQEDHVAGGRPGRHPGGARPGGRQHAGQEPELHGRRRCGRHRARRARADHPDQPRRLGADAPGLVRGGGAGRQGAARRRRSRRWRDARRHRGPQRGLVEHQVLAVRAGRRRSRR